jgi:hypothetical protein
MYYALYKENDKWEVLDFLVPRGREPYIYVAELLGITSTYGLHDNYKGAWGRRDYAQKWANYYNGLTSVPFL